MSIISTLRDLGFFLEIANLVALPLLAYINVATGSIITRLFTVFLMLTTVMSCFFIYQLGFHY